MFFLLVFSLIVFLVIVFIVKNNAAESANNNSEAAIDTHELNQIPIKKKPRSKTYVVLGVFFTICLSVYFFTGIFVIQPIGSLPEGLTVWYFRTGSQMRFIESPDGMSLKYTGGVSLMSRGTYMNSAADYVLGKKIAMLPYSESLYLISTGGRSFDK